MDASSDFPQYFPKLVTALLDIINPQQTRLTSQIFHCLALIFKHQSKRLLENLNSVNQCYGRLLGHKKEYIRNFAGESLGYLIRRLDNNGIAKELKKVIKAYAVGKCFGNIFMEDGISNLVFETLRNVQGRFQSMLPEVLPKLIHSIYPNEKTSNTTELEGKFNILHKSMKLMNDYTTDEYCGDIIRIILNEIKVINNQYINNKDKDNELLLYRLYQFLYVWINRNKGSRINSDNMREIDIVLKKIRIKEYINESEMLLEISLKIIISLWKCCINQKFDLQNQLYFKKQFIEAMKDNLNKQYYQFIHELLDILSFGNITSLYIELIFNIINSSLNEYKNECLSLLNSLSEIIYLNYHNYQTKYYESSSGRINLECIIILLL